MMAAKAGAEHVYACETFKPLAALAAIITAHNAPGLVTVIPKMSTDMSVGGADDDSDDAGTCDMPARADVLVTEIFDTALLGEGVLPFLRQARRDLLQPTCHVIPRGAVVHAQVVSHASTRQSADLSNMSWCAGVTCHREPQEQDCKGGRIVLPVHLSRLSPPPVALSEALHVLSFDFTRPVPERRVLTSDVLFTAVEDGQAECVAMWWDLAIDDDNVYSTRVGAENWQACHTCTCKHYMIGVCCRTTGCRRYTRYRPLLRW